MRTFSGKVLFLDRSDINTDEIIPAKYLTEIEKAALRPFLLEDLHMPGFDASRDVQDKAVVVTRENFGCGSSREHAPWALEVNGIYVVVAESFARIFRQNMFNCGMLAIELPKEKMDYLFATFANAECVISVNAELTKMTVSGCDMLDEFEISISDFDKALVNAGGWVEYADANY